MSRKKAESPVAGGAELSVQERLRADSKRRRLKTSLTYHSMSVPLFVLYSLFIFYPFMSTIYFSFTNYSDMRLFNYTFVGLKNYINVFTSQQPIEAIGHSVYYAIVMTAGQLILAVPLAVLLSKKFRGRNILRSIFFFPAVLSPIIIGFLWSFLYSTSAYGPINQVLQSLGLDRVNFLGDPKLAMNAVIATQIWQWTGWAMVIILANLQSIDETYYEAAKIDGASSVQCFFRITVPLLYPSMTVLIVGGLIGGLKVYDIIVGTTGGGPFNATSTIILSIIQDAMGGGNYGMAAAYSVVFFLIVLVFTGGLMKLMNKWEESIS